MFYNLNPLYFRFEFCVTDSMKDNFNKIFACLVISDAQCAVFVVPQYWLSAIIN